MFPKPNRIFVVETTISLIILIVICSPLIFSQSPILTHYTIDESLHNTVLNKHLIVHQKTGILYVGAMNMIYQLDPNLTLIASFTTGPYEDSTECSGYKDCPEKTQKVLTNNDNKVLVIDYDRDKLISCGSLYQGTCSVMSLEDVSSVKDIEDGYEPIVANWEICSTVGFIAQGPNNRTSLYVGVAYTGNSPYRDEVPAVSTRSLNPRDNFDVITTSVSSGTKIHIQMRNQYPINYVYGFSSEGFSYFLTTQKKDPAPESPFISKLVRVCQNDPNYYSYTEIPIECLNDTTGEKFPLIQAAFVGKAGYKLANDLNITIQDDVLFAIFARADPIGSNIAGMESSLCIYSLKEIRGKFVENIQLCHQGKGSRGLGFIARSAQCVSTKLIIEEDFCGMDTNTPLGGEIAVAAKSIFSSYGLSAVAATAVKSNTVVFVGTRNGHMKKVVVKNQTSAIQFDDIVIDHGKNILSDMVFDPLNTYLYVATEKKITTLFLYNCSQYSTCDECGEGNDPFCGWSFLENKILLIKPNQVSNRESIAIQIRMDMVLPKSVINCQFAFGNGIKISKTANLNSKGLSCKTPSFSEIPPFHESLGAIVSVHRFLVVNGSTIISDVASSNVTFFDCNSFVTCISCLNSTFACSWLVDIHKCLHLTAGENNGTFISLAKCPQLSAALNSSSEVLIPFGSYQKIQIDVDNFQQIQVHKNFRCEFNISGRLVIAKAQLKGSSIFCDKTLFSYQFSAAAVKVAIFVLLGSESEERKYLDNPHEIYITIYRCSSLAENCGTCLIMDKKYNCGWCQSSNQCSVLEECNNNMDTHIWLNRNRTCPNLAITRFFPSLGPWEGGSNMTIEGINLGKTFEDIYNGVTVAGIFCEPFRKLYVPSKNIVCRLSGTGVNIVVKGPVVIKVSEYEAQSPLNYTFVDPKIRGISPLKGPMQGGTLITVFGEYVNAGSKIKAFVGSVPCEIISKELILKVPSNKSKIYCRAERSNKLFTGHIIIKYDGSERTFKPGFTYVDNPVVRLQNSLRPNKLLRGISAGGIKMMFRGSNFEVNQEAIIYVKRNGTAFKGKCNVISNETITCLSPKVPLESGNKIQSALQLEYGFLFDTVDPDVDGITDQSKSFYIFPNPQFYPMGEISKNEYLIINGQNFDSVEDETEFTVLIGTGICNITSISKTQLICIPPADLPSHGKQEHDFDSSSPPEIVVKVGEYLEFKIGRLRYGNDNIQVIIVVSLVSALIVIFLMFSITFYILTKRNRKLARKLTKAEMARFEHGIVDQKETDHHEPSDYIPFNKQYEITEDKLEIHYDKKLGSGAFGLVLHGVIKVNRDKNSGLMENDIEVAVKTVKPDLDKSYFMALLSEIKIMAFVGHHENIASLLATVTTDIKHCKVFFALELCVRGDLLDYLQRLRGNFEDLWSNNFNTLKSSTKSDTGSVHLNVGRREKDTLVTFTSNQNENSDSGINYIIATISTMNLLEWSCQISNGMSYLSSKKVIHGDLAARNVLLTVHGVAKIGDFGLSRQLINYSNYLKTSTTPLPWRWLAIETLERRTFSILSDIWSFGVTLWEIFTLGNVPYPGRTWDHNFVSDLLQGVRLNPPEYGNEDVYNIMLACMATTPSDRPAFDQILIQLIELKNKLNSNSTASTSIA